jgi:hypothetical protein
VRCCGVRFTHQCLHEMQLWDLLSRTADAGAQQDLLRYRATNDARLVFSHGRRHVGAGHFYGICSFAQVEKRLPLEVAMRAIIRWRMESPAEAGLVGVLDWSDKEGWPFAGFTLERLKESHLRCANPQPDRRPRFWSMSPSLSILLPGHFTSHHSTSPLLDTPVNGTGLCRTIPSLLCDSFEETVLLALALRRPFKSGQLPC